MKLYVGKLPRTATEADIKTAFEAHGTVESAEIVRDKTTGEASGFAFVVMPDDNQARTAFKTLNGKPIAGSPVVINEARKHKTKPGHSSSDVNKAVSAAAAVMSLFLFVLMTLWLTGCSDDCSLTGLSPAVVIPVVDTCPSKVWDITITASAACDASDQRTLTATVTGLDAVGPYTYQWRLNGVDIVGATGNTYLADGGTGIYTCVVTDESDDPDCMKSSNEISSDPCTVVACTYPGAGGVDGVSCGPAPVNLGTAGNYVILTKTGITTTTGVGGDSVVIGDLGVSPIGYAAITGFALNPTVPDGTNTSATSALVTGLVYAADYTEPTPSNLIIAVSDMETAYTTAKGIAPDVTELMGGNLGGLNLVPGTYYWSTVVLIPTDVTLTGSPTDVWIFQIDQDLTVSSSVQVTLAGGAEPENIFWAVAGVVTLDTNSDFYGVVLAGPIAGVVLNDGASLTGRSLSQTNTTLISNTVTQP